MDQAKAETARNTTTIGLPVYRRIADAVGDGRYHQAGHSRRHGQLAELADVDEASAAVAAGVPT